MSGTLEEAGIVAMARYTFGGDSRPEQLKLLGEVLDSDQLGMFFGRMVRSFEERAAAFIGCAETVAHATGTYLSVAGSHRIGWVRRPAASS